MSIQNRLLVLFVLIFAVTFGAFALFVSRLPNGVLEEIDTELVAVANEIRAQATNINQMDVSEPLLSNPIEAETTFVVVTDANGEILSQSRNMANVSRVLDPNGFGTNRVAQSSQFEDQTLQVLTLPITRDVGGEMQIVGYLQVGRVTTDYQYYRQLTTAAVFIGLAALSASLLVLYAILPRMLAPLDTIIEAAAKITSANDLSLRIPYDGAQDEIGRLTQVFNQLMARLEHLFRAQQRLLADVSHELRTPLTSIRGNVDVMRYIGMADKESLDAIDEEAERMTRLVNNLLTLARAEVGGLPIRHELVDLDTIFLDVYNQVLLLNRPVKLSVKEVDQVRVLGDPDRLKQLILNLVENGTKYTPPGGTVTMNLTKTNRMARIIVSDTGVGIPADALPHIFDRFYRVDKARTRAQGGSGLGLSICKSIVDAHKGTIVVRSEVDQGSTFTVTLPVYPGVGAEDGSVEQAVQQM
ncbi:MAG: HAMP domain-containing histidine kinase [Anaerolineae bacterium]|nr:HAMP domain-containing histidine kinase [Anaerolineae bacterium]